MIDKDSLTLIITFIFIIGASFALLTYIGKYHAENEAQVGSVVNAVSTNE